MQTDTIFDEQALSPTWLYDEIMQQIEPDLVTSKIPLLDEKYKNETPEERVIRYEHYDFCLDAFDEALQEYQMILEEHELGSNNALLDEVSQITQLLQK